MSKKILSTFALMVLLFGTSSIAFGFPNYATGTGSFQATYPSSPLSALSTQSGVAGNICTICHGPSGGNRNAYGSAFASNSHSFTAIANLDSDGDGANNVTEINAGFFPGNASSTPPAQPAACTGYTYSAWTTCGANGQQTRTVTGNTPAGCTGTPSTQPVLTQACTPPPVACTSFTYSAWGPCQSNGTQTRTVISSSPANCTGGTPILSQSCTYTPPTTQCTSYTYTLGECQPNGTAPVTSYTGVPAGCSGGATPATSQPCTYTPPTTPPPATPPPATPPPTSDVMPLPTDEQVFIFDPVVSPVLGSDPAQAKPIGVGDIANGGETVDIKVGLAKFAGPVDVSLAIYASGMNPMDVYFLDSGYRLNAVSVAAYEAGGSDDAERTAAKSNKRKFRKRLIWKTRVEEVDEVLLVDVPVQDLPAGQYVLILEAQPSEVEGDDEGGDDGEDDEDSEDASYRWVTQFKVQ